MAGDQDDSPDVDGSSEGTVSPVDGDPPAETPKPSPSDRTNPLVSSLCTGLVSDDEEMAEKSGIALCLVARRQPDKVSTIIGKLVEQVVKTPKSAPTIRTLATLREDHGREIRGALITETGYTDARRIYGLVEYADPWNLTAVDAEIPEADEEPSFLSSVMRLIELEEKGRDPLDSDMWVRFIQRLLGEGGDSASEAEIERAAARQDSRPRTVRRRHRQIEQIANSRTFKLIEARSRFDELEVLSPVRPYRFGKAIRTRGRIGAEEYAITIRLPHRLENEGFERILTDRLREWEGLDEESVVTVADWGDTPQPWVGTEVVERTLASENRLSVTEALEHSLILTRALVSLHQRGIVHGGIDPETVGYPPSSFDGVVEPMLDSIGLAPVYRQFTDPSEYLDIRYGAPEWTDSQYGRLDPTTDIYHLGMVLYWALTGTVPFDGEKAKIREQIRDERPPPPSERNPELPGRIDEIIAKATAKQKLIRYENATRFHHEIRQLCDETLR